MKDFLKSVFVLLLPLKVLESVVAMRWLERPLRPFFEAFAPLTQSEVWKIVVGRYYYGWGLQHLTSALFVAGLAALLQDWLAASGSGSAFPARPERRGAPRAPGLARSAASAGAGAAYAAPTPAARRLLEAQLAPPPAADALRPARSPLGAVLLGLGLVLGTALVAALARPELLQGAAQGLPSSLEPASSGLPVWTWPAAVGTVSAVLALSGLLLLLRSRDPERSLVSALTESELATARSLLSVGKHLEAAQIYFGHHQGAQAAKILVAGGKHREAAEYYRRAGKPKLALTHALKAGGAGLELAAQIHEDLGKPQRALELYREAAEWARDEKLYTASARCFLRLGDPGAAARMMEAGLLEKRFQGAAAQSSAWREELVRAAELYLEASEPQKAAALYLLGGLYREAGDLFGEIDLHAEAADAYLAGGLRREAADALERAGQRVEADALRGELYLAEGDLERAARAFESAGQLEKAAELHLKRGSKSAAAELLARAGQHERAARTALEAGGVALAAELFEKAGLFAEAAHAYDQVQRFAEAARCYEKSGQLVSAGMALIRDGRLEDGVALLGRLQPPDKDYLPSQWPLGQAYAAMGQQAEAIACFQRYLGDQKVTQDNVEVGYQLAVLLEGIGDLVMASKYYEMVLLHNYHYKDAAKRLASVQQSRKTAEPRPGSALPRLAPRSQGAGEETEGVDSPTDVNRYQLERELGRGGMGVVYLARDKLLDRPVAFKILPTSDAEDLHKALGGFYREAKLIARLNHPNIVSVYDFGECPGGPFIVMEYIEGETLLWFLKNKLDLLRRHLKPLFNQICQGLAHAHDRGIVHRDIKPQNLMLNKDRIIKVMDFGVAKLAASMTQTIEVKGTPMYMAPEQVLGKPSDRRVDLYALGVLLYRIATGGRAPFEAGSSALYQRMLVDAPSPRQFDAQISEEFEQLILSCIARDPDARPESAVALSKALLSIEPLFLG